MNDSGDSSDTVLIECDLTEPPEEVWRALTEPALVEQWLGPDEGATPAAERELIEAEPHERVRYRWSDREGTAPGEPDRRVDSFVTFELWPTPEGGTHLRLTHSDFSVVTTQMFAMLKQAA